MSPRNTTVLQVATLSIRPGSEQAFERDADKALRLIAGVDGYLGHELRRSVEREWHYALMIEWRALAHHTRGFAQSNELARCQELLRSHLQAPAEVEHFHPPCLPADQARHVID
ncbi:MAG: antibiotic biosynthesis monooxygenase [Burkholderiaceae bacterium]